MEAEVEVEVIVVLGVFAGAYLLSAILAAVPSLRLQSERRW